MRSLVLSTLLVAVAAPPALARAQEEVVELKVGETRAGVGTERPICDAPSVAVISGGVIRAVGPGQTLCSVSPFQAQGTRRFYRVIVTAADARKPGDKADPAPRPGDDAAAAPRSGDKAATGRER
jgi:hypothetical protein